MRLAEQAAGERTWSLGELVHNKTVVNRLKDAGVRPTERYDTLQHGDTLVIRAHGAPPEVFETCKKNGVKIVDATCPFVRVMQKRAEEYSKKGYRIVLIGQENHPEIQGINGWCGGRAIITNGAEICDLNSYEKVMIMFQTTFPVEKYAESLQNLKKDNVKILEVFNTICYTSTVRQSYAEYISKVCDMCVVVGGKNSSNTLKLVDVCKSNCKETYHVETAEEIDKLSLTKIKKISIIAGASTPQELMEEVLSKMFANAKDMEQVEVNEFTKAVENMPEKKRPLKKGQKIKGIVTAIVAEGVMLNIDAKKEAEILNEELALDGNFEAVKAALKVGDEMEAMVVSTDKTVYLSKKALEELYQDDALVEDIKAGKEFELVANKAVKGGLLGKLGSYTVFIPASHIRNGFVKNLEQYQGKKLRLVALQDGVDETKHKIVASQREVLQREKQEREDNFWNNIEVGEIVEGKVLRFASFGAFVSVRGFDCLAHLSDLSWTNIKEPGEVLEIGKTYEFVVLKLDRAANRVSIGYKQLQPHPWQVAAENHPVGSVCKGKVARILPFGAFVEIEPNIDGLLHISNVSWDWITDINQVLKVGDEIEVAILEFDLENKRITLSRKATMPQPAEPIHRPVESKED